MTTERSQRRHDKPARSSADRLMDAAETMVALHGSEGVSMSAVIRASGQRHNSAITYHFGGWQGLLEAVWQRGSENVNRRRSKMLAERPSATLQDLLEIYVRPFAEYLDEQPTSHWARFNEEALRSYSLIIPGELRNNLESYADDVPLATLADIFERLQRLTGGDYAAALRVSVVIRATISTFAAWERDEATRRDQTAVQVGESLIDMSLAMLERP